MQWKKKESIVKKLREANPAITDEEIDTELAKMEPVEKLVNAVLSESETIGKDINGIPVGKKLYDKWRGQWVASRQERIRGSRDMLTTEWTFERLDTKANKTGIPLEDHQYATFNNGHFMALGKTATEMLYPHGDKTDPIFELCDDGNYRQKK